jgi:hypothetical protein
LLVSAKGVFCQWVKNGRHMVHQGPHALQNVLEHPAWRKKGLGNVDFVAKDLKRGEMECPSF